MIHQPIRVEVDLGVGASYIYLSDSEVAKTREFSDSIMVDLDRNGVVVGIEILGLNTSVPFDELARRFHIHSSVIAGLNQLRPSVGYNIRMAFGSDSSTSLIAPQQLNPV